MCFGAPAAPDYKGAAEAQGQSSQQNTTQQTWANRPSMTTPWGSMSWGSQAQVDPATGQPVTAWSGNLQLSPEQQKALDSQQAMQQGRSDLAQGLMGEAGSAITKPFDFGASEGARQAGENAIYGKMTSRLDPQWQNQQNAYTSELANQGLDMTSPAYQTGMDQFNRAKNDAYNQANYQSVLGGQQFAQGELGLEAAQRTLPLNMINALMTGQQVGQPQMPGFSQASKADTTDYLGAAGAAGNYGLASANMNNQMYGSMMQGAGSLAGGIFSDERIKTDIQRGPGEAEPGVPFASWRWKGDKSGKRHHGVIAQDLEKAHPEKVREGPGGLKVIDASAVPFTFGKKR